MVIVKRLSGATTRATPGSSTPMRYIPSCIWMPLWAANEVTSTRRTSSPTARGRTCLPIMVTDRFISQAAIVRIEESMRMTTPISQRIHLYSNLLVVIDDIGRIPT